MGVTKESVLALEWSTQVKMLLTVHPPSPSAATFDLLPCPGMAGNHFDQSGRSKFQCICMTDRNTKAVNGLIRPDSAAFLVHTEDGVVLQKVTKEIIAHYTYPMNWIERSDLKLYWVTHPTGPPLLLVFIKVNIFSLISHVFRWEDLTRETTEEGITILVPGVSGISDVKILDGEWDVITGLGFSHMWHVSPGLGIIARIRHLCWSRTGADTEFTLLDPSSVATT